MEHFDCASIDFYSERLVGIEVELDSGSTEFRAPTDLSGWTPTRDGSLSNGMEYVLSPALPFHRVLTAIKNFDERVTAARTNITSRGSLHVHVQAHDLTPEHALNLCLIYNRFQSDINALVADSRKSTKNHTFCKPLPSGLTLDRWKDMFNWNAKVNSRAEAKRGNRYWTVNCQPMSITDVSLRSVEFRQQSATRKASNIYGWVALCAALVGLSKICSSSTIPNGYWLDEWLSLYPSCDGVAKWVRWRRDYLSQAPTDTLIEQAVAVLRNFHGIHHVSRHLNVPLPVAKAICEAGRARGLIVAEGLLYRATNPSSSTILSPTLPSATELHAENRALTALLMQRHAEQVGTRA